jgi:cytochrome c oxidase cbb3-type subunit 3
MVEIAKDQVAAETPDTGHDYDGIREYDNRLPNWWLWTLIVTIVFGYGYWMYFHTFATGMSSREAYLAEMAEAEAAAAARAAARGALTDEALLAFALDDAKVGGGKAVFAQYCVACHGPEAAGLIGPNLTDNHWINGGGKPTAILQVVNTGVAAKGMPAWGPLLGPDKVEQVVAYVLTLKGKNVAGKAPEGELVAN